MSRFFEIFCAGESNRYTDKDLPLKIGTEEDAHVRLRTGRKVEAYIADYQGHLFLQPGEDSADLYHNEELVRSSVWIKSGDRTRIGDNIILYRISRDLVQIRVLPVSDLFSPSPTVYKRGYGTPNRGKRPLPRVENIPTTAGKWHGKKGIIIGALFVVLLAISLFLLMAHPVELDIQPSPDSVSLEGFPPPVRLGNHILCLEGVYTIVASRKGYEPLKGSIKVGKQGENRFLFHMKKLPGLVDIITRPVDGASLSIDGRPVGTTPVMGLKVEAGRHVLLLEKERYRKESRQILVEGMGKRQVFDITLKPGWGTASLDSQPSGAKVFEGNKYLGMTPLKVELMAGHHRLVFKKEGFSSSHIDIDMPAGKDIFLKKISLTPAPATVRVTTIPKGALMTVDDKYLGLTPITTSFAPFKRHTLEIAMPGYRPVRRELLLPPSSKKELSFRLKPEYGVVFITADPVDARLVVDGKPYGVATGRHLFTTARHTLVIEAPGYEPESRVITPRKGYSQHIDIRLRPKGTGLFSHKGMTGGGSDHAMIRLGPATFRMGASRREPGRMANEQEYDVKITRAFLISDHEVTNAEFRRFMPGHHSGDFKGRTLDKDDQPVVMVTWEDAARYCNWLSRQEGLPPFYREKGKTLVPSTPANTGYRLPTEAEWAYAARIAGRKRRARYPWPGNFPPIDAWENYADESGRDILPVVIRGYNDGSPVTSVVKSFRKNRAGLYDMGGNVSEWCNDFYTPYKPEAVGHLLKDPMGPASGTHHVIRGASWKDAGITELRLSYRGYGKTSNDHTGFRIARYLR